MALLASWPSYTDDTGTKTDGTIVDVVLLDAIKTAITDDIESATNPTVAPKTITDEVIAARGSAADLDTRLDAALNEDGTPKAVAGQATTAEVASVLGAQNLLLNSDFLFWQAGAAAAPDFWTLSGAGAAVARTGAGETDTNHLEAGHFTAKVTSGAGAIAKLTNVVLGAPEMTNRAIVQGRKVQLSALVQASAGSTARVIVDDGVGTTPSTYHTGDSTVQLLSIEHTLDSAATKIDVYLEVAAGTNVVYLGGMQLLVSDVTQQAWVAERSVWFRPGSALLASVAGEGYYDLSASGEETAWTLPGGIPAGFFAQIGNPVLRLRVITVQAGNTNAKNMQLSVGGVDSGNIWSTTTAANVHGFSELMLVRTTATRLIVHQLATLGPGPTTAGAGELFRGVQAALTPTFTSNISLALKITGAAAADVKLYTVTLERL